MEISWAGINFRLDTPEVNGFVDANINLDDLRESIMPRTFPGPGQIGTAFPFQWPKRPKPRIGQLWYPTGCSRWAEGHFVIDQEAYEGIIAVTSAGSQAFTFNLNAGGSGISTPLYCLPPRVIASVAEPSGKHRPGLYIATLVDERFFFNTSSGGILTSTMWDDLLNELATNMGFTPGVDFVFDPVPLNYGNPELTTDLYVQYENQALLMDAICWNCGLVFVRNFNATYYCMNVETTDNTNTANIAGAPQLLAGGVVT